jgi:hypothetical protein
MQCIDILKIERKKLCVAIIHKWKHYTLSFFQDHGTKLISNNWCGTSPVFYDEQSFEIIGSHLKLTKPKPIDKTGLYLYLSAGYCIYGKTPYQGISYLRPNQSIEDKNITDENLNYLRKLANRPNVPPENVLKLIQEWVNQFEESTSGKIIVPLSGGLDSRLLISFINDKSRIEAFTYGQSLNQSVSNEVKIAESLSRKLDFAWSHIELKDFSTYTESWLNKWGASTHAHGMYQMQFYSKVAARVPKGSNVISGIIGDLLAGSLQNNRIESPIDILKLDLSRGMNAKLLTDSCFTESEKSNVHSFLGSEFAQYKAILGNKRALDLLTIQNKNMLLRYLVEVPTWYGLKCASPFLDENIGINMLCIDDNLRLNRKWQKNYLENIGLGDSHLGKPGSFYNTLNFSEINSGNVNLNLLTTLIYIPKIDKVLTRTKLAIEKLRLRRYKIFMKIAQSQHSNILGRFLLRMVKNSYSKGLQNYGIYLTLIPLSHIESNYVA